MSANLVGVILPLSDLMQLHTCMCLLLAHEALALRQLRTVSSINSDLMKAGIAEMQRLLVNIERILAAHTESDTVGGQSNDN